MQTSDSIDYLAPALVAFTARVKNPPADQVADTGKYKYSYPDFAAVVEANRELLAECGLAALQTIQMQGDLIGAATMIVHYSGQWILLDPALVPAGSEPQDFGGAISYSRRYSYFAALNLVAQEDHGTAPQTQRPKAGPGLATKAQQGKLMAEAEKAGITEQLLLAGLRRDYGVETVAQLTKQQASDVIERLMKAKAAGADPVTGEVPPDDDAIGFDEGPPGMDADEYRESRGGAEAAPQGGGLC